MKFVAYFLAILSLYTHSSSSLPREEEGHYQITILSVKECAACLVWFYSEEQQLLKAVHFPASEGKVFSFSVPEGAYSFGVWDEAKKINPHLWILRDSPNCHRFDYEYSLWNDLRRGLGDYGRGTHNPVMTLIPCEE